jgi:hypothetical protein
MDISSFSLGVNVIIPKTLPSLFHANLDSILKPFPAVVALR